MKLLSNVFRSCPSCHEDDKENSQKVAYTGVTGDFSHMAIDQLFPQTHSSSHPLNHRRFSHRDVHLLSPIAETLHGAALHPRCSSAAGLTVVKTSSPMVEDVFMTSSEGLQRKQVFDIRKQSSSSGSDSTPSPPNENGSAPSLLASTPLRNE